MSGAQHRYITRFNGQEERVGGVSGVPVSFGQPETAAQVHQVAERKLQAYTFYKQPWLMIVGVAQCGYPELHPQERINRSLEIS